MEKFNTTDGNFEKLDASNRLNNDVCNYNMAALGKQQPKNYIDAANEVGMYHQTGAEDKHLKIDKESDLFNGSSGNILTSDKNKVSKLLMTRTIITTPNKSSGDTPVGGYEPSTRLGYLTKNTKKNTDLAGIEIDRFTPLVPEVQNKINYHSDHLQPNSWVRGGKNTREVLRNMHYLKSCGMKR